MKDSPVERAPTTGAPIGAVLAGGLGSRIGGDKALTGLAGRPLISYPLDAIAQAGIERIVIAKADSRLPSLDCEVIREPDAPRHPLCGVVAALKHAGSRPLIVVGCDMPLIDPALLAMLGSAPERFVVPMPEGHLQPFPGRYHGSLLPALAEALATGRRVRPTIEELQPRTIVDGELAGLDLARICFNVNTTADLERAERMLEAAAR